MKPLCSFFLEYWVVIGLILLFPGVFIFLGYKFDWYAFSKLEMRELVTGTIAWIALVIAFYRNILFSRQTDTAAKQADIDAKQADIAAKQADIAAKQADIAAKQADTAAKQADTAAKQADTAVQSHLNARYQTGTEMLGNSVLSIRIGGIYTLANLADERPELYHIQVMKLFCFTVRFPPPDTSEPDNKAETEKSPNHETKRILKLREDIQEIITIMGRSRKETIERDADYRLDLRSANLSRASLRDANLSRASLREANLSSAHLSGAILSGASLREANLSGASLRETNLSRASLREANLSRAHLEGANLSGASLRAANLSGASLREAVLSRASLREAILTGTILRKADLSGAHLEGANLSGAHLEEAVLFKADLSGASLFQAILTGADLSEADVTLANLSGVKGLTQDELNKAIVTSPHQPPTLTGAIDLVTKRPLVWQKT